MYNEIDGDFEDVAISTFKIGFPNKHGLRKSLTGKPDTRVWQLIDRIDKYKRVEEYQQQGEVRWRLSLRRGRILGQIDSIPFDLGKIMSDRQDLPTPMWLTLYFENRYIGFSKR